MCCICNWVACSFTIWKRVDFQREHESIFFVLKIIEEKECIESIEATQKSGYPPFLLVMENGGRSVWYKMGAERVAGVEPIAVFETL